jgi:hypothetical protein
LERFGIQVPVSATLTSLAVDVEQLLPDPKAATGNLRLLLDKIVWQDWSATDLSMDATLAADQATVAARGVTLGSGVSINVAAPVTRAEKAFTLGDALGRFNIEDVPALLRELAPRVPAIDPEVPVPRSTVDGNFNVTMVANKPEAATADIVLKPQDEELASAISLKGGWARDQPVSAELVLDHLKAAATYQPTSSSYQATVELDEFTNARIDRWLAIVKVKPAGTAILTGKWSGSGELKSKKHRGELALTQATWSQETAGPITAIGSIRYDWPGAFETRSLRLQMNDQTVAIDAAMATV